MFRQNFPVQLIAPISLDEIGPISSHAGNESLSPEKSGPTLHVSFDILYLKPASIHSRPAPSNRILPFQAQLDVENSEHEQGSHGII